MTSTHANYLREELVGRLANMLNYNLMTLVGDKAAEFKVSPRHV